MKKGSVSRWVVVYHNVEIKTDRHTEVPREVQEQITSLILGSAEKLERKNIEVIHSTK